MQRGLFGWTTALLLAGACQISHAPRSATSAAPAPAAATPTPATQLHYLSQPLVSGIYTADPSAHVFNSRIYIYPSHDIESGVTEGANGAHFAMRDYHVLSMDSVGGPVTDHGVALDVQDIPWARRQLWAPDAEFKNGLYYLYFPVKDKHDVFRLGVATSTSPTGPFKAEPQPITGSYSIDPAVYTDTDGRSYLYFGGIWGGQLQRWRTGQYDSTAAPNLPDQEVAMGPRVARLSNDMRSLAEPVKEVQILDENGKPLLAGDTKRRFFEGVWLHKYQGKYYLSYSTGNTHLLVYAVGDQPYGPFKYQGILLNPVQGWTTHHSIIEHKGKWYLFYHDTQLSGKSYLRNVKVTELRHRPDGRTEPIEPMRKE
ncbi:glycoside hydrolase family 43 protein [Hymenobacter busanensis]|uniref:glycoside hydrolase family 43 protein n=1 Tax=Hymenobacter busanensis TaxID=2607656 RepID=UPI001F17FE58|nr:glycoside hydrolase family 43 protein [Hymenobacter busanensis]